ncbi:MAG: pantoate--beta-alanine ligase [Acidobacteria bacterium]|nr:pantoate--beta-alanine ligase [Acidobacteriota bacterium]
MTARISHIATLKKHLQEARKSSQVGFVPTMGYLHEGHLSLIRASRDQGLYTAVSIFVNPTQFGPNEDLDQYPRDHDRDFELAKSAGADLVWYPAHEDLYPAGHQTMVVPGDLAHKLCGISRPVFFTGIATVVLKLFHLIKPHMAFFGEKDYQQLAIIKRMVRDFLMEIEIQGCATVREADGLAMSSRNVRLSIEDRDIALTLYRSICTARMRFLEGETDPDTIRGEILSSWPKRLELDYLEFRDPENLELVPVLTPTTRIFIGAWLDGVRLIDNASIDSTEPLTLHDT